MYSGARSPNHDGCADTESNDFWPSALETAVGCRSLVGSRFEWALFLVSVWPSSTSHTSMYRRPVPIASTTFLFVYWRDLSGQSAK